MLEYYKSCNYVNIIIWVLKGVGNYVCMCVCIYIYVCTPVFNTPMIESVHVYTCPVTICAICVKKGIHVHMYSYMSTYIYIYNFSDWTREDMWVYMCMYRTHKFCMKDMYIHRHTLICQVDNWGIYYIYTRKCVVWKKLLKFIYCD